ncbi:MAG TPA: alpha/beta hydrolase [Candidatus Acidoferrales bacterium]|jgi:pimeloyl-ACP methyl ester carboxylesterase|nr:alpha/beta hydrolase [Candidatus Acidoferrales bacterium]
MKPNKTILAWQPVYFFAAIFALIGYVPIARVQSVSSFSTQTPTNPNIEKHFMVDRGDIHIEVIAQGSGPAIVILPSLGRGAEDYGFVAELLAREGFRVLRPQPRGIGKSTGPMANLTLHDFAADVAAVIENEGKGTAIVVGHAYGHFVTRMLATDRPDLVRGAVLAAASAGRFQMAFTNPLFRRKFAKLLKRVEICHCRRLGGSTICNLRSLPQGTTHTYGSRDGTPETEKAENTASRATPVDEWFACGTTRVLDLQAENDAVAPRKFASVLKAALGERVTVVVIPNAGHALVPEQPQAMASAIAAFARTLK